MKNIIITLVAFFSVLHLFSQEVCVSKDETLVDVNVLDASKCVIEKEELHKKKQEIKKEIIVSSARYFKKRIYFNEAIHLSNHLKAKTILKVKPDNKLDTRLLVVLKKQSEAKISFDLVDEIPLFSSCADSSLDKTDCFNYEMQKHITKHFVYPKKALQKNIEGEIEVSFTIGVDGRVKDVKVKGVNVNEVLEDEAKRIVLLLPRFTPGKQNGVKTNVSYSFPMSFTLD